MANVDYCVRKCEEALCNKASKDIINSILEINENEKVNIFKNRDFNFIKEFLENSRRVIIQYIKNEYLDERVNTETIILI